MWRRGIVADEIRPQVAQRRRDQPAANEGPGRSGAFKRGEAVIGRAGCLAFCHTIDKYGNNGPGPPLSHIGSYLSSRDRVVAAQPDRAHVLLCRPCAKRPAAVPGLCRVALDAAIADRTPSSLGTREQPGAHQRTTSARPTRHCTPPILAARDRTSVRRHPTVGTSAIRQRAAQRLDGRQAPVARGL